MRYMRNRLFLCLFCSFPLLSLAEDKDTDQEWTYSVAGRVWYAEWELSEDIVRMPINNDPPREEARSFDADPDPFYTIYVDALYDSWRLTLAAGLSGEYEFQNGMTQDTIERKDIQFMVQRNVYENLSVGLGIHRIDNDGTTNGGRGRGNPNRDFSYSFTGPEVTAGYLLPLYKTEEVYTGLSISGTAGYYFENATAGFISGMDDTPGFALDAGLAAVWNKLQFKGGYRYLYIDDSVWSIDRLDVEPDGRIREREIVEAKETFQGFYLEVSVDL